VFEHLKKVWVVQQQLRIHEWDGNDNASSGAPPTRKPAGPGKPGAARSGGFKPGGPKPGGSRPGGFKPGGSKPPHRKP
jgi:ATP-dependent RNA helicase DeaD